MFEIFASEAYVPVGIFRAVICAPLARFVCAGIREGFAAESNGSAYGRKLLSMLLDWAFRFL